MLTTPNTPTEILDRHARDALAALRAGTPRQALEQPVRPGTELTGSQAVALFEAMATSRQLDFTARVLQGSGRGFYTIGSAGHEGNAILAAALRPTDPALLHYRSGGFYCARAQQVPGMNAARDVLLGVVAAAEEPISGGRHKVFGRAELCVIPQTSTIASHLPRAVGVGFAIEHARKLGVPQHWAQDAVVCCSFGDASASHSTALGALNAAQHTAHKGLALPVLFCCEDNGIGISVPTPQGWIAEAWGSRSNLKYFFADTADTASAYDAAAAAAAYVRQTRRPAFLHLRCVRFLGHAGADAEIGYRTQREIEADLERDPLVACARLLADAGLTDGEELLSRYDSIGQDVLACGEQVSARPRLGSAAEVMAPIVARNRGSVADDAHRAAPLAVREQLIRGKLPEARGGLTLAESINRTLADELAARPELLVFGEDVGRKGGVYGVTRGLQREFGPDRVFDTLLDEQTILGLALGAGLSGLLPVPEIQYLAYLHNAEDQIRGEAATLSFFSAGQYRNPMVVRVAGYGYQKGFGGHFHNDDSVAVLRDIPGLIVATPARPDDAAAMLRTCVAAASVDGSVCVFLEPIALYHTRDLAHEGDRAWLAPYVPPEDWPEHHVPVGRARVQGDGGDLTIVTWANGLYMSLRVKERLEAQGIAARVLDLRWLAPLPVEDLLREARATGRVLVVDETRRTGGVSEGVIAALIDAGFDGQLARVASEDSFIPLGAAANHVLLSEATIETAAIRLARG